MKICPKCHKEFSNEQGFCGNCGVKLEMKPRFCTKCGNVIEDNQKFCGKCGAKIVSDDVEILKENLSEAALTMGTNVRSILSDEMVNTAKNQMVTIFSKENTAKLKEKAKNTMRKSGKSFSFDLVKMFPKSDEQYSAYYKYLVGNTLLIFVTAIINAIYDNLMTRFLALHLSTKIGHEI